MRRRSSKTEAAADWPASRSANQSLSSADRERTCRTTTKTTKIDDDEALRLCDGRQAWRGRAVVSRSDERSLYAARPTAQTIVRRPTAEAHSWSGRSPSSSICHRYWRDADRKSESPASVEKKAHTSGARHVTGATCCLLPGSARVPVQTDGLARAYAALFALFEGDLLTQQQRSCGGVNDLVMVVVSTSSHPSSSPPLPPRLLRYLFRQHGWSA